MTVLAGGTIVLPERVLTAGSVILDGGRIAAVEDRVVEAAAGTDIVPLHGLTLVPGFIDVHVHGVLGIDVLDGPEAVAAVAARLPAYGVTAFCPTSVACAPDVLQTFLASVEYARTHPPPGSARVLPAHLESNFISPAWNGAQPAHCLRVPAAAGGGSPSVFTGDDILRVIEHRRAAVAIVTLAPELPGGLDLVQRLRSLGHLVSIGHSGATFAEARAAIAAGVTHATHLFNRMTPLNHREPGVVTAVLASPAVCAEIICDGHHVHPAVVALALAAKGADRLMAITDGTAAAGLPEGARAMLGGQPIVVRARAAELEDGTLAGSIITMDLAFRMLVHDVGAPITSAARLCATTPAAQLGLANHGRIAAGAAADLVVLDSACRVVQTWIAGRLVAEHPPPPLRLHCP